MSRAQALSSARLLALSRRTVIPATPGVMVLCQEGADAREFPASSPTAGVARARTTSECRVASRLRACLVWTCATRTRRARPLQQSHPFPHTPPSRRVPQLHVARACRYIHAIPRRKRCAGSPCAPRSGQRAMRVYRASAARGEEAQAALRSIRASRPPPPSSAGGLSRTYPTERARARARRPM